MVDAHVIAMQQIAAKTKITKVAEFGMGTVSTIQLLNREMFPDVETLISFENDPHWYQKIKDQLNDVGRWNVIVCDEAKMPQEFSKIELPDMVLVDSATVVGRIEILRYLHSMENKVPYIVLHDSEYHAYGPTIFPIFKYFYNIVYDGSPWATIFSDVIDVGAVIGGHV